MSSVLMDPAPYLNTLPAEILELIIEHTHPSGHWPLAQTCRYLYRNSERVLNLHRDAYRNFRVTSDLDPMTVFSLLWSVFSHGVAHIDAWHVREFEVWGDRDVGWWENFTEAGSDTEEDSEVDANPDEALLDEGSEALPWSPPESDIDYFCEELLKIPDFFPKTNEGPWGEQVRCGLETGSESVTKSLMLVHLPRIRAIRCANMKARHPWVLMLSEYIFWCKAAETWLPGLETLERVSVSIPPDDGYRRLRTCPDEFAVLLCLPNLSEVYFPHLDGDFDLSPLGLDLLTNGPDKTSPVRTIILDHLENGLSEKLISFLAKKPRALQNIAIRFEVIYDHEERSRSAASLVQALSEHQCKSLQRVCFDADRFPDWPFFMPGLDLKVMRLFDDLRVVNLDWPAVEMSLAESDENLPREELLDRLFGVFQLCLPDKMEILVLNLFEETAGVLLTGELARGNRDNLGYIDEAVEAAIKSSRYDNLKAVMLGYVQISLQHTVGGDWHFPKAVKAAEERGIYIGLKGDVPPPGLGLDGTFVPVPTRSCMVTGRVRTEER